MSAAGDSRLRQRLLERVPDDPLTVETRALLLRSDSEFFGDPRRPEAAVIRNRWAQLVAIIDRPDAGALAAAIDGLAGPWDVIAPIERLNTLGRLLPGWRPEPAEVFGLPRSWRAPRLGSGAVVRSLGREHAGRLDHLEGELGREIASALGRAPIMAAFVDRLPVSFCYSYLETETRWDVAIETLTGFRRRGLAAACALALIDRQRQRAKNPVWCALAGNAASIGLARRLGFRPRGRLAAFDKT